MLGTNVFIAAFKSGWTKTTELILELLTNKDYELVGNPVLLEEYRKWAQKLGSENPALQEPATTLYSLLKKEDEDQGAEQEARIPNVKTINY